MNVFQSWCLRVLSVALVLGVGANLASAQYRPARSMPTSRQGIPPYARHPADRYAARPGAPSMQPASHVLPFAEDAQELGMNPAQGPVEAGPVDGPIHFEHGHHGHEHDAMAEGDMHFEHGMEGECASCGGGCMPGMMYCRSCLPDPMAGERWPVCSPVSFLNELSLSVGTQAFKGPLDFGRVGNFGFTESINLSDAIWHYQGLGYQFGMRGAQANFSGDQALGQIAPRISTRSQLFMTAGLFHRAFYGNGWQGGAVVDYLNDRYYVQSNQFQIRSEISYVWRGGREFGFTGIIRTQSDGVVLNGVDQIVQSIDQYRLFYRRTFQRGGQARIWGGGSDRNHGLFGADFRLPISNRFDIAGAWNYLIPSQAGNLGGLNEGWGMGLNLVFYPGRSRCGHHNGPYRALFDVADNGTMFSELINAP